MRRSLWARLSFSNLLTLIAGVLCFSTLVFAAAPDRIAGPIVSQQLVKLSAGVPMRAQPQFDQGRVESSLQLGYMTLLTVPSASQQKAMNRLLAQQQDPHSPQYHKWLTSAQIADRFGLSLNDVQKISAWLQSKGFSILQVSPDRNFIVFSGSATQAESAFQTEIHNFDVNGEKHFSNTTPISIPTALSGIVTGVRGLSNFRPKSYIQHRNPNYTFPYNGEYYLYLAPGDISTIYDIPSSMDGTGQTLAVMGETDVYLSDLTEFRSGFNLPAITGCTTDSNGLITACASGSNNLLQYVLVNADPGEAWSDLDEADLDLEWSGATAPNAQIIYVNAPYRNGNGVWDSWYYAVSHNVAPVITLSYGRCELDEATTSGSGEGTYTSDEAELKIANSKGITFLNSSGDRGAAGCDYYTPNSYPPYDAAVGGQAMSYPASSPEVTGVGGTAILISEYTSTYWSTSNGSTGGSALSYIPEGAWNDDAEIGAYCDENRSTTKGTTCYPDYYSTQIQIINQQTFQEDWWIASTGGGASNCYTLDGNGICSGGFPQPTWQANLSLSDLGQTTAARFSPDVSLLASADFPGYIFCTSNGSCLGGIGNGNFDVVGGTSVSSPVFAGMVALLNQYLVANGVQSKPGLGNINPMLYSLAATPSNKAFNKVTASDYTAAPGSNVVYCQVGYPHGGYPSAQVCPSSGTIGYLSSNADSTTGYNLVTGLGSVDVNKLAIAWASTGSTTSTSVTCSPNPVDYGVEVTCTATVTTTGSNAPTGTVTFYDGTTSMGTGILNGSQVATYTTTTPLLPPSQSITATYGGDTNNAPSTSAAFTENINAATFTFVSSGSTSHTVLSGQTSLAYTFTATPTSGATFVGAVTFNCAFSPVDATLTNSSCVFSPTSIAAGTSSTGTTVTMTITTTGPTPGTGTQLRHRSDNRSPWLPLTLPIAGVVMLGLAGRKISKRSAIILLCLTVALLGFMVACGGSSSTPVSVSVSPSSASLWPNETDIWPSSTQQFTATVSNTTNTGVTWSLSPSTGMGSIDSTGLYTAPTVASGLAHNVTVIATSQADTTKTGKSVITLKSATVPGTYTVTVSATETGATTPTAPTVSLVVQ